jgi:hypothetical protein
MIGNTLTIVTTLAIGASSLAIVRRVVQIAVLACPIGQAGRNVRVVDGALVVHAAPAVRTSWVAEIGLCEQHAIYASPEKIIWLVCIVRDALAVEARLTPAAGSDTAGRRRGDQDTIHTRGARLIGREVIVVDDALVGFAACFAPTAWRITHARRSDGTGDNHAIAARQCFILRKVRVVDGALAVAATGCA